MKYLPNLIGTLYSIRIIHVGTCLVHVCLNSEAKWYNGILLGIFTRSYHFGIDGGAFLEEISIILPMYTRPKSVCTSFFQITPFCVFISELDCIALRSMVLMIISGRTWDVINNTNA